MWRQKEAALQSSQLTRLLLANSAHEVRTPLNAIINYLEIALEGVLDQETRDNLSKSHSASKSLIYVINDLLDLTNTEEGQALIKDEVFDLPATVREAFESFSGDAKRKSLSYELIEHPGIPQFVHGDQRRVRQVVANVTANAVKHTQSGWVRVELWLQDVTEKCVTVEIIVHDSGIGMSNELLDSLFRDLEQVSTEAQGDDLFGDSEKSHNDPKHEKEHRMLGLGLAMVARTVRNMDGQLRLKSEEGRGSRFVMQLPFTLAISESIETETPTKNIPTSVPAVTPPLPDSTGEVTLVERTSSLKLDSSAHRKHSIEEFGSLHSFRSGSSSKSKESNTSKKSDVDRLIDAISGPLEIGEPEPEEQTLQRTNSRGNGHSKKSLSGLGLIPVCGTVSHDRPGNLTRSNPFATPEHLRRSFEGPAGSEYVTDNKTLLKAVRMPEDFDNTTTPHVASKVLFEIPDRDDKRNESPELGPAKKPDAEHLHVLVAEDDPVNSRIIRKRLEKSGHEVHHTVNGEDCASAFGEKAAFFDVVLMDMQVSSVHFSGVCEVLY